MPVAATNSETAMQQVLDNLGSLPSATGAAELDLIFLRGIMESPIVRSLAKVIMVLWFMQQNVFVPMKYMLKYFGAHERLEETKLEAVRDNNLELVQEILRDLAQLAEQSSTAAELAHILQEPHFQSLLETHDSVASKTYETPPPSPGLDPTFSNQPVPPDAVRMVGIRKTAGEHLGVTFRVEGGELVIARILHGGMVAQQGLLHVGDIIKEVNGQPVGSDPRALQELLRNASGSVILKILPSYQEPHLPRQVFVKCHFDYDPARDSLIPCKEAGLRFNAGDLLQIVNQDDANWWQACHVEGGSAGLIPSQLLEEKRKAFVKRDLELTPNSGTLCGSLSGKKKKRMMYLTTKNAEFDRHELLIYEEVARMPPFRRKTLVLIGAQGVGRRSLKNKLIMWDPDRYGTTVPYTSRRPKDSEREGQGYSFVSRGEMEADVRAGRYLEHGEYEGNLYGTRIDSIRGVVAAGKVCVLDVNPQAVKVLRTAEFVPYVVFIEAPDFETLRAMNRAALESGISTKQLTEADLRRTVEESSRIQRGYGHYFDLCLVNSNLERTFRELQTAMEKLRTEPQWVPVSWVY
ncbi:membrane palmitoylated protein 2 [Homo sapiens]|uniref:MAGUK p55 scaffold protein 2 n=3 Tax=Homo sapiens TaxID=9606 RepID=D3DX49_HUMAN|nr:MAGUK p55 subfamily member 2 isoform 4 [Homo sapiens]EAW51653.1 membrane protein, palmitoylated 2 (MAGUK p55 subfamily member 2), isoform CRA_a [Homo sapiens]EAW51655.1 membrane protein, palmitoylated 2 (MAGUK p55 subfamily member 2), isoform CRA_a [Homo sapiens]KAI2583311.1 membrane palmitoylated protein 2 [Homo sapiens]KAI4049819.1 membrane palmitoylated protein 2 [Homo sapiens]|eukprot:NP_001265301.1 MAGUK p55 subfamily member 2 isoform 4 [Homo sapiens]